MRDKKPQVMKKFRITYCDNSDPACPEFSEVKKAFSSEHAEDLFYDDVDSEGFEVTQILEL